jgi:tRNA modification GTPase
VTAALASLEAAEHAAQQDIPHEMVLLGVYEALRSLDSLTGATTPDDVLILFFRVFVLENRLGSKFSTNQDPTKKARRTYF